MFVPIGEFAPDADSTKGMITSVLNMDASERGYKGAPAQVSTGVTALAAACTGAALVKTTEAANSLFAGTSTALYKLGSTTWSDVTRLTGGAYTAGYRWRFSQFGNTTIAVNRIDATQYYTSGTSTDFENLANTPKARITFTVNDFCFLLGTNEATYGDQADRWWNCALGVVTDWTPDIATQCSTNRLYDVPGPFTAGAKLSDYAVLFKERAIYLGQYVGPPLIWDWTRISDVVGASSHEAVQNIGQALVFCNKDGFFMFDGTSVAPIGEGRVSRWWQSNLDKLNAINITSVIDRKNKTVRWWFPVVGGTGALTAWISYNWQINRFGYGESTIEATLDYATPSVDYTELAARYATYSDLPDATYDAVIFLGGTEAPAVMNESHETVSLTGATESASITTGDIGEDGAISLVSRVRNRYLKPPTTATLTNYYSDQVGTTYTTDATTSESSGKFDLLRSARWHKFKLETTGSVEIVGADVTLKGESLE